MPEVMAVVGVLAVVEAFFEVLTLCVVETLTLGVLEALTAQAELQLNKGGLWMWREKKILIN